MLGICIEWAIKVVVITVKKTWDPDNFRIEIYEWFETDDKADCHQSQANRSHGSNRLMAYEQTWADDAHD